VQIFSVGGPVPVERKKKLRVWNCLYSNCCTFYLTLFMASL